MNPIRTPELHRGFRMVAILALAIAVLVVAACGAPQAEYGLSDVAMEPEPSVADRGREEAGAPAEPPSDDGALPASQTISPSMQPAERLRVYAGELELVVASVEDTRERIIALVEETGGYVERSETDFLILRVPADRFSESLEAIEALGNPRSRVVTTTDVTEEFRDLERRIDLATATRERLYRLLERSRDNDERLRILREIRRLTEEIETLQGQLESLDEAVRFSRISVYLVPRIQESVDQRTTIPFPWIAWLDPIERTTGPADDEIEADLPADYASFSEGRFVRAETPEGTQLRIGAVANDPAGDTSFWENALKIHLGKIYLTESEVAGDRFRGALFQSKSVQPFYYLVAVAVRDEEIVVAEVFFPDGEALTRRRSEVVRLLQEVRL